MRLFLIVSMLAYAAALAPANALDFTQPILQLDGSPIQGADGKPQPDYTLEKVAEQALLGRFQDESSALGDEMTKRYDLAQRIYNHKADVTLSVEELSLVKRLIGKAFPPLIVGQAWHMLDPSLPKDK